MPPRIGRAVLTALRHVPGQAACPDQALAAKLMLARRGQSSALNLGARHDEAGALAGHTWLRPGGEIDTGSAGLPSYTPLMRQALALPPQPARNIDCVSNVRPPLLAQRMANCG